ncbi:L-type lectin-domain containing receptor kinase IX.1 [Morus notabilis]|uniref:non-specific serine/threonine protein kinase n=1 Tax=Morus notabilis TaxID=981085 RepID=W9R462_9ROSA|nr:L-type lectin-domain containing receptor kinase IX.1 [Morus notabilis]EXB54101.1 L-type lectin-domain containing receptor kinase IX.1 [Morus notabilis]
MILSKPFSCLNFLLIKTIFFLFFLPNSESLFNFTSFSGDENIIFQGDSSAANGTLQLTKVDETTGFPVANSVGRASFSKPVQLWNNNTGKYADFTAHFTFRIKANDTKSKYGDGISFFIAPFESDIPANSSGGYLALLSPESANDSRRSNPIVAVEFDSYQNSWDPSSDHVGINVDSIESATTIKWNSSIKDGRVANAWVSYVSASNILSVYLTYVENPEYSGQSVLAHRIDWKEFLPQSVRIGFSAATGDSYETHNILSWSFISTLEDGNTDGEGKSNAGLGIGLGVGFGALGGLGLILFIFWRRRAAKKKKLEEAYDESIDVEFGETGPKRFTYRELSQATNEFSEQGKLGQGGFGGVYRGVLSESNMEVAVKRISKGSTQGKKEYISEVKIISRLRHKNLVQLIGWCHTKGEFLLVYELLPNGSLDIHLFGGKPTLIWSVRYKIAHGLASSLLYLHEEWEECVVHRDIKSSNVMLDSNFNAKLGDFGLARLADHESGLQTTVLAGTMGYMAPECVTTGKASKESDVYSFGVVALEICCGRRPVERNAEPSKVSLVEWAWNLYGKGQVLEAADTRLNLEFDEEQMECLMVVGLWCCHPEPSFRPSIKQVVNVLNFEAPLPNLPPNLPRPMYFAPSTDMNSSFYSSSGTTSSTNYQNQYSSGSYLTDSSKSEGLSIPLQKFSQG